MVGSGEPLRILDPDVFELRNKTTAGLRQLSASLDMVEDRCDCCSSPAQQQYDVCGVLDPTTVSQAEASGVT